MGRGRVWAQMGGLLVAGLAMVAPHPSVIVRQWSAVTIYPWWAAVYVVLGVLASLVALRAGDLRAGDASWSARVVPTALVVAGAQLAGLGLVAVKHWAPAIGMGGGYAGHPHVLMGLAGVVAAGGMVACLAAIAQLRSAGVLGRPAFATAMPCAVLGAVVLLVLPFGIAEGDPGRLDVTSLGAFVLIYSGPIDLTVAVTAWLAERLRAVAMASCAVAAALSAAAPMIDLTHLHGGAALVATAIVLTAVSVTLLRAPPVEPRRPAARPGPPGRAGR